MPRYTITEPHPSVAQNSYIHSGRGGAGNFLRAPLTTAPSGVPTPVVVPLQPTASRGSLTSTSSTASRFYYSGRGGAGNAHAAIERPVLSFEEEYNARARRGEEPEAEEAIITMSPTLASHGHLVGRGGAGNFAGKKKRSGSSSSSSAASSASGRSGGSVGWRRRLSNLFRH